MPEPHNPWDARAVAFDLAGRRVAYLPATAAKMWHDVVRAWNTAGFAVYVRAEVNRWESDGIRSGLTVPKWPWQMLLDMANAAGLHSAWQSVMTTLTEEQRLLMRQDGGYTPVASVLKVLHNHRDQHPVFTWGTTRDGDLGGRMPFWYGYFVREQIRHERQEQQDHRRFARAVKSALTRAFHDEIKRRTEQEREQARLRRRHREQEALRLKEEGLGNRDIAAALDLTPRQAEGLLHRARKTAGITLPHNEDLQKERLNAAAQALLHKRSGMARTQIAKTMGRSVESVKELLQDAVFYEAPEDHPERLALARRCITLRNTHLNKEAVMKELQVTRGKALRAFRDAAFLESQRQ